MRRGSVVGKRGIGGRWFGVVVVSCLGRERDDSGEGGGADRVDFLTLTRLFRTHAIPSDTLRLPSHPTPSHSIRYPTPPPPPPPPLRTHRL